MALVVDRVDVCAPRHEELYDGLVSRDYGQMERSVALLVLLVEQLRLGRDDLIDAVEVLVLGAVVQRGLARAIAVLGGARLRKAK